MSKVYLENATTGARYDVVKFDKGTGEITLRGPLAQKTFTEKFDREAFERMGYVLKQEENTASG